MSLPKPQLDKLIQHALDARNGSYSRYSNFRVGACLLSEEGEFVKGANVENVCGPGGICAERTAIVKGVSEGIKKFIAVAVTSDTKAPISPCGICRQVLCEFCPPSTPVYLVPAQYSASTPFVSITEAATSGIKDGNYVIHTTLGEILPIPYGPDQYEYRKKLRETGGKAKL